MKITYIEPNGAQRVVEADVGDNLMQLAKKNRIAGIEADCGGACICATCHIYIEDPVFLGKLVPASEEEEGMLDFVFSVQANSRLSCQIVLSEEMDGMIVSVPKN